MNSMTNYCSNTLALRENINKSYQKFNNFIEFIFQNEFLYSYLCIYVKMWK